MRPRKRFLLTVLSRPRQGMSTQCIARYVGFNPVRMLRSMCKKADMGTSYVGNQETK